MINGFTWVKQGLSLIREKDRFHMLWLPFTEVNWLETDVCWVLTKEVEAEGKDC